MNLKKRCDNNKWTLDRSEFNAYQYFSHVLQSDSFSDLTTCKSKNII